MNETGMNEQKYIVADNPVFSFGIPFSDPQEIHCRLSCDGVETELVRDERANFKKIGFFL